MQKAKKYVMALDQGTTSSRCILFDRSGKVCSVAQKEFAQYYPQPGWVEHNPMEIWSSQLSVAVEAMGQIGAEADDIAAIGITNQRETTICFSKKTGKPVYPAIVWQCRRTADKIDALKKDGFDKVIRERTGLHQVVLSGGVFQNMYLLPRVIRRLEEAGFEVYHHSRVSANDEGISLGQTMIAAKGGGQHVLGNSVSTGSN